MYNIYIGQLKGKPEEFKIRETKKKNYISIGIPLHECALMQKL